MISVPPKSPLFPYTTLFRSVEHERPRAPGAAEPRSEIRAVALEREPPADIARGLALVVAAHAVRPAHPELLAGEDRKSTRLNSSHANISYAVFCLKKKKDRD